jgi:photosystem II stability/assembly factor-like uncharacterized protein
MWTRHTVGGGGGQTGIAIDPMNTEVVYVTTDNGGIIKSTDGGETWFSINNNIGNRLLADVELDPLDPNVIYVAAQVYAKSPSWSDDPTNGELYRSRDGGQSWEIVHAEGMGPGDGRCFGIVQWPSTRSILIPYDPADPDRYDADSDHLTDMIYIGGWDADEASADKRAGIWKSTDEGVTFTQIALNDKNIWVLRQDPDDPETLYAGTHGDGLFVSRDGGINWEDWCDRIPIPMISDIAIVPNTDTLYVATNGLFSQYGGDKYRDKRGIYKSTDGGASFFPVNSGLEKTSLNFEVLLLDRTDSSGKTLYTGPWWGNRQGIYKTTDGGVRWTQMKHEVVRNPYWFSRFDNLWTLEQADDGTMFAGTWRGIYRYNPTSQRWEIKVNGLGNVSVQSIAFEPGNSSTIYLGILDSTPWKSVDKGLTWSNIGRGFTTADGAQEAGASDFAISETNPQIIYATGIGSSGRYLSAVNKSQDGGAHWRRITNGLPATTSEDPQWQATAIVVSAHDPDVAYVALQMKSGGGRIYKTINGGRQWNEVYAFPENPTDLAISSTDPETIVCATERGVIHVGKEGGSQWQSHDLGLGLLYAVDVFPTDPDRILVGANIAGAFLTTDGGDSWQHIFDADKLQQFIGDLALSAFARERYWPTTTAVKFDPHDPNTLYIGHNPSIWMGIGVLKSTDGGQSWVSLTDAGFQMRSVSDFDLDPLTGDLAVGTWEVYYYHADAK